MPANFGSAQTNGLPLKPTANTWTTIHTPGSARDRVVVTASYDADAAFNAEMRISTSGEPMETPVAAGAQRQFAPIIVTGASQVVQVRSVDGKASFHCEYVQVG